MDLLAVATGIIGIALTQKVLEKSSEESEKQVLEARTILNALKESVEAQEDSFNLEQQEDSTWKKVASFDYSE